MVAIAHVHVHVCRLWKSVITFLANCVIDYPMFHKNLYCSSDTHQLSMFTLSRIACISCPTLFTKLLEVKPASCQVTLLEYDQRFDVHGEDFIFYDYRHPLDLPDSLIKGSFDLVAADPPFLSEECLTKTSLTIRHLTKNKILLCTGKSQ